MIIHKGDTFWTYYGYKNNPSNKKIHIVDFVDEDMVVFKWWRKHSNAWRYEVEPAWWFGLMARDESLHKENGICVKVKDRNDVVLVKEEAGSREVPT